MGCGHQETFVNCADISIRGWTSKPDSPQLLQPRNDSYPTGKPTAEPSNLDDGKMSQESKPKIPRPPPQPRKDILSNRHEYPPRIPPPPVEYLYIQDRDKRYSIPAPPPESHHNRTSNLHDIPPLIPFPPREGTDSKSVSSKMAAAPSSFDSKTVKYNRLSSIPAPPAEHHHNRSSKLYTEPPKIPKPPDVSQVANRSSEVKRYDAIHAATGSFDSKRVANNSLSVITGIQVEHNHNTEPPRSPQSQDINHIQSRKSNIARFSDLPAPVVKPRPSTLLTDNGTSFKNEFTEGIANPVPITSRKPDTTSLGTQSPANIPMKEFTTPLSLIDHSVWHTKAALVDSKSIRSMSSTVAPDMYSQIFNLLDKVFQTKYPDMVLPNPSSANIPDRHPQQTEMKSHTKNTHIAKTEIKSYIRNKHPLDTILETSYTQNKHPQDTEGKGKPPNKHPQETTVKSYEPNKYSPETAVKSYRQNKYDQESKAKSYSPNTYAQETSVKSITQTTKTVDKVNTSHIPNKHHQKSTIKPYTQNKQLQDTEIKSITPKKHPKETTVKSYAPNKHSPETAVKSYRQNKYHQESKAKSYSPSTYFNETSVKSITQTTKTMDKVNTSHIPNKHHQKSTIKPYTQNKQLQDTEIKSFTPKKHPKETTVKSYAPNKHSPETAVKSYRQNKYHQESKAKSYSPSTYANETSVKSITKTTKTMDKVNTSHIPYTQNKQLQDTEIKLFTPNKHPQETTVKSYTKHDHSQEIEGKSYSQNKRPQKTAVKSYTRHYDPKGSEAKSFTLNKHLQELIVKSYTHNKLHNSTEVKSYTPNKHPQETMKSSTQNKYLLETKGKSYIQNKRQNRRSQESNAKSNSPNKRPQETAEKSYIQHRHAQEGKMKSYTPYKLHQATTVISYTEHNNSQESEVKSYSQNKRPQKTAVKSYIQHYDPKGSKVKSFTSNKHLQEITVKSYTHDKLHNDTEVKSSTQNKHPLETKDKSYTQKKIPQDIEAQSYDEKKYAQETRAKLYITIPNKDERMVKERQISSMHSNSRQTQLSAFDRAVLFREMSVMNPLMSSLQFSDQPSDLNIKISDVKLSNLKSTEQSPVSNSESSLSPSLIVPQIRPSSSKQNGVSYETLVPGNKKGNIDQTLPVTVAQYKQNSIPSSSTDLNSLITVPNKKKSHSTLNSKVESDISRQSRVSKDKTIRQDSGTMNRYKIPRNQANQSTDLSADTLFTESYSEQNVLAYTKPEVVNVFKKESNGVYNRNLQKQTEQSGISLKSKQASSHILSHNVTKYVESQKRDHEMNTGWGTPLSTLDVLSKTGTLNKLLKAQEMVSQAHDQVFTKPALNTLNVTALNRYDNIPLERAGLEAQGKSQTRRDILLTNTVSKAQNMVEYAHKHIHEPQAAIKRTTNTFRDPKVSSPLQRETNNPAHRLKNAGLNVAHVQDQTIFTVNDAADIKLLESLDNLTRAFDNSQNQDDNKNRSGSINKSSHSQYQASIHAVKHQESPTLKVPTLEPPTEEVAFSIETSTNKTDKFTSVTENYFKSVLDNVTSQHLASLSTTQKPRDGMLLANKQLTPQNKQNDFKGMEIENTSGAMKRPDPITQSKSQAKYIGNITIKANKRVSLSRHNHHNPTSSKIVPLDTSVIPGHKNTNYLLHKTSDGVASDGQHLERTGLNRFSDSGTKPQATDNVLPGKSLQNQLHNQNVHPTAPTPFELKPHNYQVNFRVHGEHSGKQRLMEETHMADFINLSSLKPNVNNKQMLMEHDYNNHVHSEQGKHANIKTQYPNQDKLIQRTTDYPIKSTIKENILQRQSAVTSSVITSNNKDSHKNIHQGHITHTRKGLSFKAIPKTHTIQTQAVVPETNLSTVKGADMVGTTKLATSRGQFDETTVTSSSALVADDSYKIIKAITEKPLLVQTVMTTVERESIQPHSTDKALTPKHKSLHNSDTSKLIQLGHTHVDIKVLPAQTSETWTTDIPVHELLTSAQKTLQDLQTQAQVSQRNDMQEHSAPKIEHEHKHTEHSGFHSLEQSSSSNNLIRPVSKKALVTHDALSSQVPNTNRLSSTHNSETKLPVAEVVKQNLLSHEHSHSDGPQSLHTHTHGQAQMRKPTESNFDPLLHSGNHPQSALAKLRRENSKSSHRQLHKSGTFQDFLAHLEHAQHGGGTVDADQHAHVLQIPKNHNLFPQGNEMQLGSLSHDSHATEISAHAHPAHGHTHGHTHLPELIKPDSLGHHSHENVITLQTFADSHMHTELQPNHTAKHLDKITDPSDMTKRARDPHVDKHASQDHRSIPSELSHKNSTANEWTKSMQKTTIDNFVSELTNRMESKINKTRSHGHDTHIKVLPLSRDTIIQVLQAIANGGESKSTIISTSTKSSGSNRSSKHSAKLHQQPQSSSKARSDTDNEKNIVKIEPLAPIMNRVSKSQFHPAKPTSKTKVNSNRASVQKSTKGHTTSVSIKGTDHVSSIDKDVQKQNIDRKLRNELSTAEANVTRKPQYLLDLTAVVTNGKPNTDQISRKIKATVGPGHIGRQTVEQKSNAAKHYNPETVKSVLRKKQVKNKLSHKQVRIPDIDSNRRSKLRSSDRRLKHRTANPDRPSRKSISRSRKGQDRSSVAGKRLTNRNQVQMKDRYIYSDVKSHSRSKQIPLTQTRESYQSPDIVPLTKKSAKDVRSKGWLLSGTDSTQDMRRKSRFRSRVNNVPATSSNNRSRSRADSIRGVRTNSSSRSRVSSGATTPSKSRSRARIGNSPMSRAKPRSRSRTNNSPATRSSSRSSSGIEIAKVTRTNMKSRPRINSANGKRKNNRSRSRMRIVPGTPSQARARTDSRQRSLSRKTTTPGRRNNRRSHSKMDTGRIEHLPVASQFQRMRGFPGIPFSSRQTFMNTRFPNEEVRRIPERLDRGRSTSENRQISRMTDRSNSRLIKSQSNRRERARASRTRQTNPRISSRSRPPSSRSSRVRSNSRGRSLQSKRPASSSSLRTEDRGVFGDRYSSADVASNSLQIRGFDPIQRIKPQIGSKRDRRVMFVGSPRGAENVLSGSDLGQGKEALRKMRRLITQSERRSAERGDTRRRIVVLPLNRQTVSRIFGDIGHGHKR